jgi:hypothetical protein
MRDESLAFKRFCTNTDNFIFSYIANFVAVTILLKQNLGGKFYIICDKEKINESIRI